MGDLKAAKRRQIERAIHAVGSKRGVYPELVEGPMSALELFAPATHLAVLSIMAEGQSDLTF